MKTALTLAMLAILFTGCAPAEEEKGTAPSSPAPAVEKKEAPAEEVEPETPVEEVTAEPRATKAQAIEVYRDQYPAFTIGVSDSDIDDLAESTCAAFDAGATPEMMVIASMENDLAEETGGTMMLAAYAYCPEYLETVEDFANSY